MLQFLLKVSIVWSVCVEIWLPTPTPHRFMLLNVFFVYSIWDNNEAVYIDDTSANIIQIVSY
jgi:hypothetical protein